MVIINYFYIVDKHQGRVFVDHPRNGPYWSKDHNSYYAIRTKTEEEAKTIAETYKLENYVIVESYHHPEPYTGK